MKHQQHTLMTHDPGDGTERPYPSHADQYRDYYKVRAWLFNPWTGARRRAEDVGTDTFGHLILPPGEPVYAAPPFAGAAMLQTRQGRDVHAEGGSP